jgi:3-carboxy-cis,cis-muconate cycloisomerase
MTFSALDSELLGPLFTTTRMREVFSDRARVAAMLEAEAALARAQARFGLAPPALAAAIEGIAAASLDLDDLGAATALAGVPAIPFVKAVQARLPGDLEPFFHKGSTSQDIVDTGLVLQMRRGLDLLLEDLDGSLEALAALAEQHRATPCVGRTYGQHAQPTSFGYKAAVWAAGLAEVAAALPRLRTTALRASLGGPVGTLAGLGERGLEVADAFAAELDLAPAPISWHTRRAGLVELGLWLATLMGALAKMAADIVHLASTEVGEVREPHAPGRGGSSAMPHKRNPVSATVILAAHGTTPGFATTLLSAMAAAGERPAGPWHAEWHALPSLFGLASGALSEAHKLARGLEVDPARMATNLAATRGLLFADAAAARLAPDMGRQQAYSLVEAACDRVRQSGDPLRDVLAADPACRALDIRAVFDAGPAVQAACGWVDRAIAEVARVRAELRPAFRQA